MTKSWFFIFGGGSFICEVFLAMVTRDTVFSSLAAIALIFYLAKVFSMP